MFREKESRYCQADGGASRERKLFRAFDKLFSMCYYENIVKQVLWITWGVQVMSQKINTNKFLKNVRIGLWRIEVEEGKLPRFYADEVMDELLGITEEIM